MLAILGTKYKVSSFKVSCSYHIGYEMFFNTYTYTYIAGNIVSQCLEINSFVWMWRAALDGKWTARSINKNWFPIIAVVLSLKYFLLLLCLKSVTVMIVNLLLTRWALRVEYYVCWLVVCRDQKHCGKKKLVMNKFTEEFVVELFVTIWFFLVFAIFLKRDSAPLLI